MMTEFSFLSEPNLQMYSFLCGKCLDIKTNDQRFSTPLSIQISSQTFCIWTGLHVLESIIIMVRLNAATEITIYLL